MPEHGPGLIGRQLSIVSPEPGTWPTNYAYDAAGNRTQITWPSGPFSASYAYDALNRMTNVCFNITPTARVTATALSGGLLATYSYEPLGRLAAITRSNGTSTAVSWDNANRLHTLNHDVAGTASDQTTTFSYNRAGQLLGAAGSNAVYDFTNHPASTNCSTTPSTCYTYNGLNQDAAIAALSGGYNGRGDLTNDGSRTYSYDVENHLTAVGGSPGLSLTYDPTERLYQTTSTGYLYAGDQLVEEDNASGGVLRRYVPGASPGQPLVWNEVQDSSYRWLYADHQGSVIAWADSSGTAQETYAYGPYGEPQRSSGGSAWLGSRFRYTGQIALPEVSLYHYKARAYDPMRGWFLQTDPVGYRSDLDLYAYVHEDPVDGADPTGLSDAPCAFVCAMFGGPVPINDDNGHPIGYYHHEVAAVAFQITGRYAEVASLIYGADSGAEFSDSRSFVGKGIDEALHGHHPYPKYLGGPRDQELAFIKKSLHMAFHGDLQAALKEAGLPLPMGGRTGSTQAWAQYFAANPGAERKALQVLIKVTKDFDKANGTKISAYLQSALHNTSCATGTRLC
jgi:RHS repeat-associated protein